MIKRAREGHLQPLGLTFSSNSAGFSINLSIFSVTTIPGYSDTTATFSSSNSDPRRDKQQKDIEKYYQKREVAWSYREEDEDLMM